MTAVPFPLSVKDRPPGSGPDSDRAGAGYPVARTVSLSASPTLALIVRIFLMAGGGGHGQGERLGGSPVPVPGGQRQRVHSGSSLRRCRGAGRGHREGERHPERRRVSGAAGERGPLSDGGGRDRDGNGPVDTVLLKRLHILAFIEHGTRPMHLGGVTANPTPEWKVQEARNLAMSLDKRVADFTFQVRDRGSNFTASSRRRLRGLRIRILRTAVQGPA